MTWVVVRDCQLFVGLRECGGEMVKRLVLTIETYDIPGQLTASLQSDTLALLVHITQNNSVEGETCNCRLPPRSR